MKLFKITVTCISVACLICFQQTIKAVNQHILDENIRIDKSKDTEVIPKYVVNYLDTNFQNWEIPDTSDYAPVWWAFHQQGSIPFFVSTDINDDQLSDYGIILKNTDSIKFVILIGGESGILTHWILQDFAFSYGGKNIQYGLSIEPPGRFDIVSFHDQSLILKSNAIALLNLEIIEMIFYWEEETVKSFRMR